MAKPRRTPDPRERAQKSARPQILSSKRQVFNYRLSSKSRPSVSPSIAEEREEENSSTAGRRSSLIAGTQTRSLFLKRETHAVPHLSCNPPVKLALTYGKFVITDRAVISWKFSCLSARRDVETAVGYGPVELFYYLTLQILAR